MKKILEIVKKYKIQILAIIIILLLIPIVKITIHKINQNYQVEIVSKEKYFVLLSNHLTGIIDQEGNIIIEPQYYNICIPNPSKAIFVCYYDYNEETGKCKTKVINAQGTELFSKYKHIDVVNLNGIETTLPYEKNLLKYQNEGKFGLINLEGDVITEPIYEEIDGLSCKEGELLVKKDNQYGVINNKGVELIKIKYDYIAGDEYYTSKDNYQLSGYIVGRKTKDGYRYGYINNKKKLLLNTDYNEIIRIGAIQGENTDQNIFMIARKNGQCGLIKNKKVVIDFKYQDINYSGVQNLFIITRNTKLGVCNTKGKVVLNPKYEELQVNEENIVTMSNGKEEYFNLNGEKVEKELIQQEQKQEDETIENTSKILNSTIIPDEKNGKWGFIDKNEKVVVDYLYDEVTQINKYGYAGIKKNGKWGSIDEKGNVIQEPSYDLDQLEEINFIGKYYRIVYDYRNIYYSDDKEVLKE